MFAMVITPVSNGSLVVNDLKFLNQNPPGVYHIHSKKWFSVPKMEVFDRQMLQGLFQLLAASAGNT